MDEEELCAGPEGALFVDGGGGACFLVFWLELVVETGGGVVGHVEVEDALGVHDEVQPAEKLVRAMACRSCTSHSALQVRWNK
jgi:hypothetical protein